MKHAVKHIHFVGVGGAGMSGIAEILHNLGYTVSGSDQQDSSTVRRLGQHLDVLTVVRAALLLVDRTALRLAPEGAPGRQPVRGADPLAEVRAQQRIELRRGIDRCGGQCRCPVLAILLGEIHQRLGEQLLLGLEMKVHQAVRQPREIRHFGQRGARIAARGDRGNRGLDQLLAPGLAARLPGRRRLVILAFCDHVHAGLRQIPRAASLSEKGEN
jgi:hypothetical protein